MLKKLIVTCTILLIATPAFADSPSCIGKIGDLGVVRSGTVYVNGPGGLPSVYICNLATTQNNVDPEACKAMYSTLLAAKAADKNVDITFLPALTNTCSEFSGWTYAPNVNWVVIK
ncbi:MAG: hypothetical protein ABUS47_16300 [Steroidobacter sp.]